MLYQWIIFIALIFIIPIAVANLKLMAIKKINPTEEQKKIADRNCGIYIIFYWICDFFYMAIFLNSLVLQYLFGGLIMLIIFYNLSTAVINGAIHFKWGLIQDFIIGVGLSVYLIYIIPNKDLQAVVIPTVSAVYGGLITLVGVAWTIKDSNKKRREDLERIERERIESEKKKARPLFSTVPIEKMPEDDSLSCWADPKHYKIGGIKVVAKIVNSDNSNFYIRKILIENCWCDVIGATHVLKGREISIGYFRDLNNEKTTAILNIEDVLGNNYYYRLEYYANIYEGFFYACSAEQISEEELPK